MHASRVPSVSRMRVRCHYPIRLFFIYQVPGTWHGVHAQVCTQWMRRCWHVASRASELWDCCMAAIFSRPQERERSETHSSITTAVCLRFRHATAAAVVPPRCPDGRTARSLFATRTCSSTTRRTPTPSVEAKSKPRGAQPSRAAKNSKSGGTPCNWERRAGGHPTASTTTTTLAAQRSRTTKRAPQHRHGADSSSRGGSRSNSSGVSPSLQPRSVRKRTIPRRKRRVG